MKGPCVEPTYTFFIPIVTVTAWVEYFSLIYFKLYLISSLVGAFFLNTITILGFSIFISLKLFELPLLINVEMVDTQLNFMVFLLNIFDRFFGKFFPNILKNSLPIFMATAMLDGGVNHKIFLFLLLLLFCIFVLSSLLLYTSFS